MKFEKARPYRTPVIGQTRLYTTDKQVQSNMPLFFEWGGIIIESSVYLNVFTNATIRSDCLSKQHTHEKARNKIPL